MNISKSEIYHTVLNILGDLDKLNKTELEEKYKTFKESFFKLFETCIGVTQETKPKFLRELAILLNMRESQLNGSKTAMESNVQVSEYMAKQYVYPITGEPSLEQKKVAMRKIIQGEA